MLFLIIAFYFTNASTKLTAYGTKYQHNDFNFPSVYHFWCVLFLVDKTTTKKAQQQKDMLDKLVVGDELILTSGIICVVDEIPQDKDYIFVKLNTNNVVRVFKDAIAEKYEEKKNQDIRKNKFKKNKEEKNIKNKH